MANVDIEKESIRSILYSIEDASKTHYDLLLAAIEFQSGILDRMWILAQRYTLLTRGVPAKRTCPPEACHLVENEIRSEFHLKLSALDDSNTKLTSSLSNVKEAFYALGRFLGEMDSSQLTAMYHDDPIQPSITYFLELFTDFVKFFTNTQSKFNCYATLLRVDQVSSLERYKTLLVKNDEFNEHFLKSLSYCGCLHINEKENT